MSTESTESTALATREQRVAELEEVAKECRSQLANVESQFGAAFEIARLTKQLNALITDEMMGEVMALRGNALGFRTDKDQDPLGQQYSVDVVRPAFIEATVRGFRPVNNEFNIIAGRFYGCKAGFQRLVRTYPGLTNFEDSLGIPERQGDRAFVTYAASWLLDGEEMNYHRGKKRLTGGGDHDDRIVVRVNAKMIDDAILGKATRKAYAGVYDLITGHTVPTPEGDVGDVLDVQSRKSARKADLFDAAPSEPSGPNEGEQDAIVKEYGTKIEDADAPRHIGPIAKKAGRDTRLTTESRREVIEHCNTRRRELSGATA